MLRVALVGLGVVAVLSGCGGGDAPPRAVAVSAVCGPGEGRVEVQGFLRLPDRISLTDRAVIDLYSERGGEGDRAQVEFVVGDGPNQLQRPEPGYTPTSMRVQSAEGIAATLNDRVVLVAAAARDGAACVLREPVVMLAAR